MISINLQIFSFFEDGCEIIYCPVLNLYGYAETKDNALISFNYAFEQFIDYCTKNKTLQQILLQLGWFINENHIRPPTLIEMLVSNEDLRNLIENKTYTELEREFNLSL